MSHIRDDSMISMICLKNRQSLPENDMAFKILLKKFENQFNRLKKLFTNTTMPMIMVLAAKSYKSMISGKVHSYSVTNARAFDYILRRIQPDLRYSPKCRLNLIKIALRSSLLMAGQLDLGR